MKPIAFSCTETLPLTPEDIAEQILDVTKWPAFRGYGPIPGIKSAESRDALASSLAAESV